MSLDFNNFSPRANQVMVLARKEAVRLNHEFVGTEHLLLGLIELGQGGAFDLLKKLGLNPEAVRQNIEGLVVTSPPQKLTDNIPNILYTPRVKKILGFAQHHAMALSHPYVCTEDLLLGIMQEGDGVAARVLKESKLTFDSLWNEIRSNDPGHRL
jgi:ATP-dependent Clp protease ATP-binding subunit ClpC